MLSSVPESDTIIVADLEAGIGTLSRLPEASVQSTLVIVEPTPRSIDVGQRAVLVATERSQGHITIVANKVANEDDAARVRDAFAGHDVVTVPEDQVMVAADRQGASPIDVDSDATAVQAIGELAMQILGSGSRVSR